MYYAVKTNEAREAKESLPGTFDDPRKCLAAARAAFGRSGGLQFVRSRLVLL